MKAVLNVLAIALLLFWTSGGFAQGFVNLNFESPNLAGYPIGSEVPATNAFPGWTVNAEVTYYDTVSLSGGSISLIDSNSIFALPPIQGKYFTLLESEQTTLPGAGPISIGQTGQIPFGSESITFWGQIGGMQITLNGQPLSFVTLATTANYSIYGANISGSAGDPGQLLFTEPTFSIAGEIDNIQFSPTAGVPEPGIFGLSALGGLIFGFRRRCNSSR